MTGIPHIRDYPGKRIHLIGIGGSSMSGLAEMLLDQGYIVTGSDRDDGYLLDTLRKNRSPSLSVIGRKTSGERIWWSIQRRFIPIIRNGWKRKGLGFPVWSGPGCWAS